VSQFPRADTLAGVYAQIKAYERREFDRLTRYLEALDRGGWVEQSYCTDWLVYQVVSHIGSGCRIGGMRLRAWVSDGPAVSRDVMQQVWGFFDGLQPEDMLSAYRDAATEYLAIEAETPDNAGLKEVEGFAGRRPLSAYQLARTWELACHSWDVYVSRDRNARLDPAAVELLAADFQYINLPLDKDRAAALTAKPIRFELQTSKKIYTLDPAAERPRVQPASSSEADAPLVIEAPDEELIRFLSGRHFIPGTTSHLKVTRGSAQDLAGVRRAFR
jgi:uncharacterized protein (TIGR03083 family)